MKIVDLKKRLRVNRRSEAVSVSIPDDVRADLDRVRKHLGFSTIEALIRAYVGQGLRADLERIEAGPNLTLLVEALRKQGVDEKVIAVAMREAENETENKPRHSAKRNRRG